MTVETKTIPFNVDEAIFVRDYRYYPSQRIYVPISDDPRNVFYLFTRNAVNYEERDGEAENLARLYRVPVLVSVGVNLFASIDTGRVILDYRSRGLWRLWGSDTQIERMLRYRQGPLILP